MPDAAEQIGSRGWSEYAWVPRLPSGTLPEDTQGQDLVREEERKRKNETRHSIKNNGFNQETTSVTWSIRRLATRSTILGEKHWPLIRFLKCIFLSSITLAYCVPQRKQKSPSQSKAWPGWFRSSAPALASPGSGKTVYTPASLGASRQGAGGPRHLEFLSRN